MRNRMLKNLLALLLVLALTISMFPVAFAEGEEVEEPAGEVVTEEPATEEPGEEPAEEPAGEEEGEEEEAEPVELPYGLVGLPEDFGLTERELAGKQALREHDVLTALANAVPGVDYVDGQVIVTACSEDYARMIADAYNADLVRFSGHIALLQLRSATVYEAVEAGMNPAYPLPPVDPNYIRHLDPTELDNTVILPDAGIQETEVPVKQSWQMWIDSVSNPDVLLRNPGNANNHEDYTQGYQYTHDMVNTYEAWPVTTGESWVTVAVLDSGVDYTHPELQGKVILGEDCIDWDGDPMDEHDHGTHCAGIIAATQDNGIGGSGIAPGVQILAVRVLDESGWSDDYSVLNGIYYAADAGADIISMSLVGPYYDYSEQEAIDYAYDRWVTVIAAMGNDGSNFKSYPAAYDHVIAVASVNPSGERSPYSNYGAWCDIAAPGSDVWSTLPGGDYGCWDGTSMACPVVAGAAALYMSWLDYNPGPDTMEKVLKKAVSPCKSSGCGAGIIDVSKLFSGDKTAPVFVAYTPSSYNSDGSPSAYTTLTDSLRTKGTVELSPDDYISFRQDTSDNSRVVVITDDGKAPSVLNGEIKHGWSSTEYGIVGHSVGSSFTLKALYVSGMGVVSKVATWKVKVVGGHTDAVLDHISVAVKAPDRLVSGKSVTLSASVTSSYGYWEENVDQTVTWSIVSQSGCPGAKLDAKTGKLSSKASDNGWVRVRAASKANPDKYDQAYVNIKPILPVASMTLNYSALSLYRGESEDLLVVSLLDKNKQSISIEDKIFKWTSSNPSVVYVNEEGWIWALRKGSATITCEVLDGSGKKASCKVKVLQEVIDIDLIGQPYAVSGTKVKYKAVVLPDNADDKGVIWSLRGAPAGVTISQKGEVSIPGTVTSGSFLVAVSPHDDYDSFETTMTVTIKPAKAKSVTLDNGAFYGPSLTKNKAGCTTAATLFSLDTPGNGQAENVITLKATVSNGSQPLWTSSKPSVATVDQNGVVTAVSAGTATITAAAQDGSGKKAACKITVTNPVSYITVKSKNPTLYDQDDFFLIGIGKSAANKVILGDAYGKPTNTKVAWSYKVFEETWGYNSFEPGSSTELTSEAVSGKWIALNSSGKLTVNKSIRSRWEEVAAKDWSSLGKTNLVIYVTATAKDGTGVSGTARYLVTPLCTKINVSEKSVTVYRNANDQGGYAAAVYLKSEGGYYESYTVTSSNPNVASAKYAGGVAPYYNAVIQIFAGQKAGTATITIKANDGSGKSVKVKVKVVD